MNPAAVRVIGIGQPAAGDDNAGLAVARALRAQRLPDTVEVHEITDPARLVDLLPGTRRAVLVDAVVSGDTPGQVLCLEPADLAAYPCAALSSHTLPVAAAIELARSLDPAVQDCDIRLVGICIEPPARYAEGMTAAVAAAVPHAVARVMQQLDDAAAPSI